LGLGSGPAGGSLGDRNSAQKQVWRAEIVLATAEGGVTAEIVRRAGMSKPCVWRWRRRFMEAGVDAQARQSAGRRPD
jgi:transposase